LTRAKSIYEWHWIAVNYFMGSLRSILNTQIRIPGIKPRPKEKRVPWVLRHCPESKRRYVVTFFTFAGLIAHMIFYVAGLFGIILIPLFLAAIHPDAPIAAPMRWLRAHFSHDMAVFVYVFVSLGVALILTYVIGVFDYLRCEASEKKSQDKLDSTSD
jgi:hypothetical protein